jgi:hypothetical protein
MTYGGDDGRLKYSFVVHPGADPSRIRLALSGADSVAVNGAGELEVRTKQFTLVDDAPYAYQEAGGKEIEVESAHALISAPGAAEFGYSVGAYDRTSTLVIDPASFVYAGFLGAGSDDRGLGIAVDASGNAYVTGQTLDVMFGDLDAYVAKIGPGGALVYFSVFGGTQNDAGFDVAVDAAGDAYVTGATSSGNYPGVMGPDLSYNGGFSDVLISKLAPNGATFVYSGFLGGLGVDFGEGIAVDASGSAYVEGPVASNENSFPVTVGPDKSYNGGAYDTFVAKVKPVPSSTTVTRNYEYCGFIGGSGEDAGDFGGFITDGHVAVDGSGALYVSGMTLSNEATFPAGRGFRHMAGFDQTQNGDWDAYAVKVAPSGRKLEYATFLGGIGQDVAFGMKVDGAGNAYFTGLTESDQTTFPVVVGPDLTYNGGDAQGGDGFVAKLAADGNSLAYCGYIGGSDVDGGFGVALQPNGALTVIGYTESSEATFPEVSGPDLTFNGAGADIGDAFVARVKPVPNGATPESNYDFCGYVGGSGNDQAFWVALDAAGAAYVVGDTESTEATFPDGDGLGALPGPDSTENGGTDAFVVKVTP